MTTYYTRLSSPGFIRQHRRSVFKSIAQLLKDKGVPRTSKLTTPVERIEDHSSEVFTCEFHPHGELLMSGGMERQIHICSVYGEGGNVMFLRGHDGAIMEAHFSNDGTEIFSCASDDTLAQWDTFTGIEISRLRGHECCVNTMQVTRRGPPILCSGSDDGTIRIWDVRQQLNAIILENDANITAACFNDAGDHIFTGGLEHDIKIWDIKMCEVVLRLKGHKDAVTGVALSPCGSYLLSHSLDNTLRIWDIRTFVSGQRCKQVIESNQRIISGNLLRCAWSPDGRKISAGSADTGVPVWFRKRGSKVTELPGHKDTVNDVAFHPNEPIIASASSDDLIFLHELMD